MADIDIFGSFTLQTNFVQEKSVMAEAKLWYLLKLSMRENLYRACTNIEEGYSQIKYEIIKKNE